MFKDPSLVDWLHNVCMLHRADLSLMTRHVAKKCLKSDWSDSLFFKSAIDLKPPNRGMRFLVLVAAVIGNH